MDGVLLLDKPSGPTSHDVVARLRRSSGERSLGHTGTLDPRATGLLVLVFGRATRLASLLSGRDKTYAGTVRLGVATDTDDAEGTPLGEPSAALPDEGALDAALAGFRGAQLQVPPSHSAKKIAGERAYERARRAEPVELAPVPVTVHALERTSLDGDLLGIRVVVTSGFYVRALARDLGVRLGCGAHLSELRRLRSEPFGVEDALSLDEAERLGQGLSGRLLTPADALPDLAAVRLTEAGLVRATHGNRLGPEHLESRALPPPTGLGPVKVLASDGRLVALAHSRGGALHPVVVLG
jgi:tRNA pseudouridine55 synthase